LITFNGDGRRESVDALTTRSKDHRDYYWLLKYERLSTRRRQRRFASADRWDPKRGDALEQTSMAREGKREETRVWEKDHGGCPSVGIIFHSRQILILVNLVNVISPRVRRLFASTWAPLEQSRISANISVVSAAWSETSNVNVVIRIAVVAVSLSSPASMNEGLTRKHVSRVSRADESMHQWCSAVVIVISAVCPLFGLLEDAFVRWWILWRQESSAQGHLIEVSKISLPAAFPSTPQGPSCVAGEMVPLLKYLNRKLASAAPPRLDSGFLSATAARRCIVENLSRNLKGISSPRLTNFVKCNRIYLVHKVCHYRCSACWCEARDRGVFIHMHGSECLLS